MILLMSVLVPSADGDGGAQRLALQIDALSRLGPVHFVLLARADAKVIPSLDHLKGKVAGASVVKLTGALQTSVIVKRLPWGVGRWVDVLRFRSPEVPRFSKAVLRDVARQLPVREARVVVAAWLTAAVLLDQLIRAGLLKTDVKIADLVDHMSLFRERRVAVQGAEHGRNWRALERVENRLIRRAEKRIVETWDAASVCSDEDVRTLQGSVSAGRVVKIPNVTAREALPPRRGEGTRFLFVGNMKHPANLDGLHRFLDHAWPIVARVDPSIKLTVVGLSPPAALAERLAALGIELHADAPSVVPFYADCDALIAPIFFGGGTRTKILESMAFGRPVISTTPGAEGLNLTPGEHAVIADTMEDFAAAMLALAADPEKGRPLAANAARFQRRYYSPQVIEAAVREMVEPAA